jgi:hypothetical protein
VDELGLQLLQPRLGLLSFRADDLSAGTCDKPNREPAYLKFLLGCCGMTLIWIKNHGRPENGPACKALPGAAARARAHKSCGSVRR